MTLLLMLAGLMAGMTIPVQTAVNSRLRGYTKSPFIASWVSFLIGTLILIVLALVLEHGWMFDLHTLAVNPWWIWFGGGALGVFFLTSNILLMPRLGSALTVVITLCGQMSMALLIDNFGWFGVPIHEFNIPRLIGIALMFFGVILMQRF
ncbi:DMT family transporter [Listeria booriae]|uniref:DMT family transporter n=1 Tax=Listeria booriae TaxID=1552123 RepID=A0A7X0Z4E2_9LIST|nr:DMT family transporter [Listeria booriae]MBC2175592.1 DMT family transporter [Listeria booriae]